jgi:hypothetical protein
MPPCGATLNENSVTPWITEDFRGGAWTRHQPTPALRATPPREGIFGGDSL